MNASTRRLLALAIPAAIVAAYVLIWLGLDQFHIDRTDFTAAYSAGDLLRAGRGAALYSPAVQAQFHAAVTQPDPAPNLPYDNPPLSAVAALPFTLLPLDAAYRAWGLLQVLLVALAAALAWRTAPGRQHWNAGSAAVLVAVVASLGTWSLLVQGQWDGALALGVAAYYALSQRGHPAAAGFALALTFATAKPQLAVGLTVFLLVRANWREIAGAFAAVVCAALASLAAVGPAGLAGFAQGLIHAGSLWDPANMIGVIALPASIVGIASVTIVVTVAADLVLLGALAVATRSATRRAMALELPLGLAVVISLLNSPHGYSPDVLLLGPVVVWTHRACPARVGRDLMITWILVNLALLLDIATGAHFPPGETTPLALLVVAAVLLRAQVRSMAHAPVLGAAERPPAAQAAGQGATPA